MSKIKKEIPEWAKSGHAKPVTRREFLAHGIIPFAATTFMPNWMKLLAPEVASAAECPAGGSSLIPVVQLNLSGGAGLMANFVPMDAGRNLLSNYTIMGLGDNQVPIVREFGNAPFAGMNNGALISNVLSGIRTAAQVPTINNTAFIAYCVRARDDSRDNYYAINGLVNRAGLVGTKLPHLGTNSNTNSGINQQAVLYSPPSPLIVRRHADVANALQYTNSLGNLRQAQKEKVAKLVADLNNTQARRLASVTSGSQIQDLIECAGVKNTSLIQEGTASVDPRTNAAVSAVWGLTATPEQNLNNAQRQNLVFGSMVYNTLLGQAGSCSMDMGGYDYHGNPRTVTNARDNEAGLVIGRVLETARVLNRPVYLVVTSDGAVSSERSAARDTQFNSDRGSAGVAYTFLFNPAGRPATTDFQVGHFTNEQAADDKFIIGNSPELAVQAMFLNYLKLNNRMDLYSQIVPSNRGLDAAGINQVVKVG